MTALNEILLMEAKETYDSDTWNTIVETLVAALLNTNDLKKMVSAKWVFN